MIKRGRKFEQLRGYHFRSYEGMSVSMVSRTENPVSSYSNLGGADVSRGLTHKSFSVGQGLSGHFCVLQKLRYGYAQPSAIK